MFKYLSTVLLAAAAHAQIETEESVLVLTDANLAGAIADNEHILVEFYAPWCGHCKNLAPHYAKAAEYFEDNEEFDVKLGKLDATENNDSAQKYGVSGYPTIKFFKNGDDIEFNGGRTSDEIIAWLKKKTGPAFVEVADAAALDKLKDSNDIVVVFAGDVTTDNKNAQIFIKAATVEDEAIFAMTTDHSLLDVEADEDRVVLFKNFDEKRAEYSGKITKTKLANFVSSHLLPLVVEFNDKIAPKVFGGNLKEHILYFRDPTVGNDEEVIEGFRKVATNHKGELLFIAVDMNDQSNGRIAEFFGIKGTKAVPTARIININASPIKYIPDDFEATEENFEAFAAAYLAGELEPSLNSEEIPENWDEDEVKIIVGKNFKSVVLDETKNVLLMAHAPWCGHCKSLAPVFDELAETFEDDESVIIAKMDSTANEVSEFSVQSFPTLKFFPAGGKKMLDYDSNDRDLESLTAYINKNAVRIEASDDEPAEKDAKKDEL